MTSVYPYGAANLLLVTVVPVTSAVAVTAEAAVGTAPGYFFSFSVLFSFFVVSQVWDSQFIQCNCATGGFQTFHG